MEALKLKPQIVKDNKGSTVGVFLTAHEYESILVRLEGLNDTKSVDIHGGKPDKQTLNSEHSEEELELNKMSLAYAELTFSDGWTVDTEEDEYWNSFVK